MFVFPGCAGILRHRAAERAIVSMVADEKRVCLSIQAKASLTDTRIIHD
jgi:hypothetical protein